MAVRQPRPRRVAADHAATAAARIKGRTSTEIAAILGYEGRAEIVHRDDMAVGR